MSKGDLWLLEDVVRGRSRLLFIFYLLIKASFVSYFFNIQKVNHRSSMEEDMTADRPHLYHCRPPWTRYE